MNYLQLEKEINASVAAFKPVRRFLFLKVMLVIAAALGVLAYTQFGPIEPVQPVAAAAFRFGHDVIGVPDRNEPLAATDNARQRLVKQLVFLTIKADDGLIHLGTGLLVSRDLVATVGHTTGADASPAIEVACFHKRVIGQRVYRDPTHDLSLIRAPGCGGRQVRFATGDPANGETLAVIGYNVDIKQRQATRFSEYVHAIVPARLTLPPVTKDNERDIAFARKVVDANAHLFAVDAAFQRGNSGSTIMNEDGSVVGMAFIVRDSPNGLVTFATSAADLAAAIATVSAP